MQSSLGPEPSSPFPLVPVSVPVSDPSSGPCGLHLPSKKGALQPRASQRQQCSTKSRGPPDSPQLVSVGPTLDRGFCEVGDDGAVETGDRKQWQGGGRKGRGPGRKGGCGTWQFPQGLALRLVFGVCRCPV